MKYGNSNPDYTPDDIGPSQTSPHPVNWKVDDNWERMTAEEQAKWIDEHPEELKAVKITCKSNYKREDEALKEADIANDSLL